MEIKTTSEIIKENSEIVEKILNEESESENYKDEFKETYDKKWIAVDEIIQLIEEHKGCKQYHELNGRKATCLDIVLNTLKPEVNQSHNNQKNNPSEVKPNSSQQ